MDATVEQFEALARDFERNPTLDLLRQLEALTRQIQPRLAALGAASLVAFQDAVTVVVAALASPVALGVLATAGIVAVSVAWWYLVLGQVATALQATILAMARHVAEAVSREVAAALDRMGLSVRTSREFGPCWDEFVRELEELFKRGFTESNALVFEGDAFRDVFERALQRLLECLFPGPVLRRIAHQLRPAQENELRRLMRSVIQRLLPAVIAGVSGLAAGGDAVEAAELTPAEAEDLIKKTGLRGVHRSGGFEYGEFDEPPPTDRPLTHGDVDVDPGTPLQAFTDDQLEARKSHLARMIEQVEQEIRAAERELAELGANPENDTHRSDVLRLRLEILRRESTRLRRALQNANAEGETRDKKPAAAPPPVRPAELTKDDERRPTPAPSGVSLESVPVGTADQPRAAGWKVRRLPDGMLEYSNRDTVMVWDPARMRWEPIIWGALPPDPNPIDPRTGERMAGPGTF